jgi:hypothetical protein
VIQIPFLDRGLSLLDEGSAVALADALARGGLLYAEHRSFVSPLTNELLALAFRVFGAQLWVGRLFQAIVFSGCTLLCFAILRQLVSTRWAVCGGLAMLALKPLAYPLWTIVNYSQVAMLFVLLALWAWLRAIPERRGVWILLAGVFIGLAGMAKQNLGVVVAASTALALVLDWAMDSDRRGADLARRSALLATGAALPVAVIVGRYALLGSADDFFRQAVLGLVTVAETAPVALPPILPWAMQDTTAGLLAFAYFPPAVVDLIFQNRLPITSPLLFPGMELFAKAAYYVPALLGLLAAATVVLRAQRTRGRVHRSGRVAVILLSALAYISMLYRADWAHLVNVYPPLIVLMVVALAVRTALARVVGSALLILWLGVGGLVATAALTAHSVLIETPSTALHATLATGIDVKRVLRWLDQQPRDEPIAFMPAQPLYYFLAGRTMPLSYDLVMPGTLVDEGDEVIARELLDVDTVVYDPSPPFFVNPLGEFAPLASRVLAERFEIEKILARRAIVLRSSERLPARQPVVLDLWERARVQAEAGGTPETWMFYRVLSAPPARGADAACFSVAHRVEAGQVLATTPLLDPATWLPAQTTGRRRGVATARGWIEIETSAGDRTRLQQLELAADHPPRSLQLSLDAWSGHSVKIRFCSSHTLARVAGGRVRPAMLVGWAEPRILGSAGSSARAAPAP